MINVEIKDEPRREEPDYPYIGCSSNGCVVLFTRRDTGTCLASGKTPHELGKWEEGMWYEAGFHPLEGSLTLRNT